jgi:hypothetical protein
LPPEQQAAHPSTWQEEHAALLQQNLQQSMSYIFKCSYCSADSSNTASASFGLQVVAKDQPDRLLVIAQWRAPLNTFVLEVCAVWSPLASTVVQGLLLWLHARSSGMS